MKERERARVGLRFMTRARKGGRERESKNRDTSSETPANQDCIPRVSHSKATAQEAGRRTSGRHETKGEDGDEAANFPPKGGRKSETLPLLPPPPPTPSPVPSPYFLGIILSFSFFFFDFLLFLLLLLFFLLLPFLFHVFVLLLLLLGRKGLRKGWREGKVSPL